MIQKTQQNVPEISKNQMEFMKSIKEKTKVVVNGISAEIQPYLFPPVSPYSYSTRVLLDNMHFKKDEKVLEIGIGCGILSVFAAKQGAIVEGVDIIPECIEFSNKNAKDNGVEDKTKFYISDMFSNVHSIFDTIICNLPILEGELPDEDPRWLSLFDPEFKFHKQLFSEGKKYAKRIILAHANLRSDNDFEKLEYLAKSLGWEVGEVRTKEYSGKKWKSYEFIYEEEEKMNEAKIREAWCMIIEALGLDLSDANFKDTPDRIVREYKEIFSGINNKKEVANILKTSFPTDYSGMVIESPIICYSMCPHHFLPVIYEVSIGYIPEKGGLGLSKLPRLVELIGKAPKLQEDFTKEIVDILQNAIKPKGVMIIVKGQHLCMQMRGIKKPGCVTTTSHFSGVFEKKETRDEFLSLIKN